MPHNSIRHSTLQAHKYDYGSKGYRFESCRGHKKSKHCNPEDCNHQKRSDKVQISSKMTDFCTFLHYFAQFCTKIPANFLHYAKLDNNSSIS